MHFDKGDIIPADWLNLIDDNRNTLRTIRVGRNMIVKNFPGGIFLDAMASATATLPIPQYQYMVLQAVAQNVLGADFVRCHPLQRPHEYTLKKSASCRSPPRLPVVRRCAAARASCLSR